MQYGHFASYILSILLVVTIVAGLKARGLLTRCLSFATYLLAIGITTTLLLIWPDTFSSRRAWLTVEVVHGALRHLVALELAFHTFRAFPAAQRRVRGFLRIMTVAALVIPFIVPAHLFEFESLRDLVVPRMLYAALGLFIGLGTLVLWYRLPLHAVHKAILLGLVPYLLVFSLLLNYLREFGVVHIDTANLVNPIAWSVMATFWAYVVWKQPAR